MSQTYCIVYNYSCFEQVLNRFERDVKIGSFLCDKKASKAGSTWLLFKAFNNLFYLFSGFVIFSESVLLANISPHSFDFGMSLTVLVLVDHQLNTHKMRVQIVLFAVLLRDIFLHVKLQEWDWRNNSRWEGIHANSTSLKKVKSSIILYVFWSLKVDDIIISIVSLMIRNGPSSLKIFMLREFFRRAAEFLGYFTEICGRRHIHSPHYCV